MARKRATPAAPPPTPERVAKALRAGDFAAALHTARHLPPTPDNLALRKKALAEVAGYHADRDKLTDFYTVMAEAAADILHDAAWLTERACLLARGGNLESGLKLADPGDHPKVIARAADRAARLRSKDGLPADLHVGLDAILAAFGHHEAGDEAAARAALEPVGLRSPFLDWKVLLRGLLAHAAGDDARAAENFARLDAARLPARLAAPYRVAVDPAYKAALPADAAGVVLKQHEKLTAGPVADGLRAVAKDLGRDKPLGPAFKAAEKVLPLLKQTAPHLVGRLANCLYHAVVHQGDQKDLPRFRELFGPPADDPDFHRLLAQVGELIDDPALAHTHWQRYEAWLGTAPADWPPAVAGRARALIWARMGDNARAAAERDDEPAGGFGLFAPPKKKPKVLSPAPAECFARAAALAPDWADASRKLFESLVAAKKPADAEAAARAFLARHPDNLPALAALAELLQGQGRAEDAAGLWLRAAAINPLDKPIRYRSAVAVLAAARRKLTHGDAAAADALFDQHQPLLQDQTPAGSAALRSVVKAKLGRAEEAAALRDRALAVPGARVSAAYRVMVDSQLAKLKPAEKQAANKLFAAELAKPPAPLEASQLVAAYDAYHLEAVTYRGQKTHAKKLLDQVLRCFAAAAPEVDFERLIDVLLAKGETKHAKKLADACVARFPANPHVLFARCEAGLATGEREYHVEPKLRRAKTLAEASTEPRHRPLLGRIDALLKQVASPFDFLDAFFGRGR